MAVEQSFRDFKENCIQNNFYFHPLPLVRKPFEFANFIRTVFRLVSISGAYLILKL